MSELWRVGQVGGQAPEAVGTVTGAISGRMEMRRLDWLLFVYLAYMEYEWTADAREGTAEGTSLYPADSNEGL